MPQSQTLTAFFLCCLFLLTPQGTFATPMASASVANSICAIVWELRGPVARGVAAFGIVFLGFSLFLGKISWGVALSIGIGMGAIFSFDQIVHAIEGSNSAVCCFPGFEFDPADGNCIPV